MQICCCSLGRGRAYCAVHQGYSCNQPGTVYFLQTACLPFPADAAPALSNATTRQHSNSDPPATVRATSTGPSAQQASMAPVPLTTASQSRSSCYWKQLQTCPPQLTSPVAAQGTAVLVLQFPGQTCWGNLKRTQACGLRFSSRPAPTGPT